MPFVLPINRHGLLKSDRTRELVWRQRQHDRHGRARSKEVDWPPQTRLDMLEG
jgi:hypothetical protein